MCKYNHNNSQLLNIYMILTIAGSIIIFIFNKLRNKQYDQHSLLNSKSII